VRSVEKGKEGEREVARLISKWVGVKVQRNLVQARERGQEDLTGLDGWLIQVKWRRRLEIAKWWRELVAEARERSLEPALWWRTDGETWMVRVPLNGDLEDPMDVSPLTWLEGVRARLVVRSTPAVMGHSLVSH
jgi:hypothetical protein